MKEAAQPGVELSPQPLCQLDACHFRVDGPRCINFDIYEDGVDQGVQAEVGCCASPHGLTDHIQTVTFDQFDDEESFRAAIDNMVLKGDWQSFNSIREPDVPVVLKVVKPFVTIDARVLPVEVPAGIHGVISTMDTDFDMYVFFPALWDVYKMHPWRWTDKKHASCLNVGFESAGAGDDALDAPERFQADAQGPDQVHTGADHKPSKAVAKNRCLKKDQQKERQLAKRAAKVMM